MSHCLSANIHSPPCRNSVSMLNHNGKEMVFPTTPGINASVPVRCKIAKSGDKLLASCGRPYKVKIKKNKTRTALHQSRETVEYGPLLLPTTFLCARNLGVYGQVRKFAYTVFSC